MFTLVVEQFKRLSFKLFETTSAYQIVMRFDRLSVQFFSKLMRQLLMKIVKQLKHCNQRILHGFAQPAEKSCTISTINQTMIVGE